MGLLRISKLIKEVGSEAAKGCVFFHKIEKLGLTARAENCLKAEDVYYIGDLVQLSKRRLLRIPNLGVGTFNEIKAALKNYDDSLELEMNFEGVVSDIKSSKPPAKNESDMFKIFLERMRDLINQLLDEQNKGERQ